MEIERHQGQHSNLQSQRHYEQLPDAKGQRQAACEAIARCLSHALGNAGSHPAVQGAQINPKLRRARLVRGIPGDIFPASQGAHIRLHSLFHPWHSQSRDAADGHESQLKTGIAQGQGFCNQQNQRGNRGGIQQLQSAEEKSAKHDNRRHDRSPQDGRPLFHDRDIRKKQGEGKQHRHRSCEAQLPASPKKHGGDRAHMQSSYDQDVKRSGLLEIGRFGPVHETAITQQHGAQHTGRLR